MSLIRNLIKEPEEQKPRKKKNGQSDDDEEEQKPRPIVKSATDLQRLRLEKLMKNPDKPILIPEAPREKDYMQTVPSFVRNVMGSSAGAGSGEFHVYRHLRRKEYARQKTIHAKSVREQLDDEYQQKLEDNRRIAEEKTAKKRAKRLKRKQRAKKPREQKEATDEPAEDDAEESSDDNNDQEVQDNAHEKQELKDASTEIVSEQNVDNSGAETTQVNVSEKLDNEIVIKKDTPFEKEVTDVVPNMENNAQTSEEVKNTTVNSEGHTADSENLTEEIKSKAADAAATERNDTETVSATLAKEATV